MGENLADGPRFRDERHQPDVAAAVRALERKILPHPGRIFDSIEARNELAVKLMYDEGVVIDDLYAVAKPVMETIGRPNDVHFAPAGYSLLAKAVAESIAAQLQR